MKTLLYSVLFSALMAVTACSTGQTSATTAQKTGPDYSNYTQLVDVLRRQGGLQIVGTGSNVKIYIRGVQTITLDTQPLYVIDGVPMGTDYNVANSVVVPSQITSVRVLRDKSQTIRYGELGTNGVIVIKTKSGTNN